MRANLAEHFLNHAATTPDAPALFVDGCFVNYGDLAESARMVAGWLVESLAPEPRRPWRVALVVSGTLEAYASLLGSSLAGVTYVPISPWFPVEYVQRLLARVAPDAVFFDRNGAGVMNGIEIGCPCLDLSAGGGQFNGCFHDGLSHQVDLPSSALVHVMFTSGSTGEPKMVGQSLGNIDSYLAASRQRYGFCPTDRVSHFNELGWDPYLLDLFGAWDVGATVYAIPRQERIAPANFIAHHRLTTWYSVPSVVQLMARLGSLRKGAFPELRLTLFVGEPLTPHIVRAWTDAAPHAMVENVYGPTECTVVCTGCPLRTDSPTTPGRDYYPLGRPYPGTWVGVIDDEEKFLPEGGLGELVIGGAQVAPGYLDAPELTSRSFIPLSHPVHGRSIWYRTGDLGMRDADGVFHFMGRRDNQVKVMGNRVELEAELPGSGLEWCKTAPFKT